MKISVCVCTYRRPELLAYLLWCFEQQTYPDREMIILDDIGQLEERCGNRWDIVTQSKPLPSLGAKRNKIANWATGDFLVPWDDDDLYTPWALEAVAAGLDKERWVRPSLVLEWQNGKLYPVQTYSKPDKSNKAYHGSWGFRAETFWHLEGYDPFLSGNEDANLSRRLSGLEIPDADPMEQDFDPYYVYWPWKGRRLTHNKYDPQPWEGERIKVEPMKPPIELTKEIIMDEVPKPRGW